MTAYRYGSASQVARGFQRTHRELQLRVVPVAEILVILQEARFRDDHGEWWTLGPSSLRWYAHREKVWSPSEDAPAGRLLAPARWFEDDLSTEPARDPDPKQPAVPGEGAPEVLARFVSDVRRQFESGLLDSESAEALLKGFLLLDRDGRAWRVGWRTGAWYAFSDGRWQRREAAPDRAELQDPAGASRGDVTVPEAFVETAGDSAPELPLVTWAPPPGHPEMPPLSLFACAACGAWNLEDARFCSQCGRSPRSEASAACATCGKPLPSGMRFCTGCGAPVGGTGRPPLSGA